LMHDLLVSISQTLEVSPTLSRSLHPVTHPSHNPRNVMTECDLERSDDGVMRLTISDC